MILIVFVLWKCMQFIVGTFLPSCYGHHGWFKSFSIFERHTKVNPRGHIVSYWHYYCFVFGICVHVWGSGHQRAAANGQVQLFMTHLQLHTCIQFKSPSQVQLSFNILFVLYIFF
jgi:hypothetical protein